MTEGEQKPRQKRGWKEKISYLSALLLMMLAISWAARFAGLPRHKGQTVKYWVDHACATVAGADKYQEEVRQIGAPAVPYLIKKLRTKDSHWRAWWKSIKDESRLPASIQRWLPDIEDAVSIRRGAAECLGSLGLVAKPAVPALIEQLDSEPVAADALVGLYRIGPDASGALPNLRRRLAEPIYPGEQIDLARTMGRINRETNVVLQVFAWSLFSSKNEPGFLVNATRLLDGLGAGAAPAIPNLLKIVGDASNHWAARGNAAMVLGHIGIKNDAVVAVLSAGVKDADLRVRSQCATALWTLDGGYADVAVPIIIESIVSDQRLHPSAINFIQIAKHNKCDLKSALPALKKLANGGDPMIRETAAGALREIDPSVMIEGATR